MDPAEGHVFHNRLTHTLKVSQIARRFAEQLMRTYPDRMEAAGGLDADVVETAALVHDLGHPPFGHLAEKELDRLLVKAGHTEGYEGNAQSFRIVTKLAVRSAEHPGLDLTRATLSASLKYPWFRADVGRKHKKFGAYRSEKADFDFARAEAKPEVPALEAQVMDRADDIAYAVHDLEDFYRAGLVPLERLAADERERRRWLESVLQEWQREEDHQDADLREYERIFGGLLRLLPIRDPYRGTRAQRAALRSAASFLISRFVNSLSLEDEEAGGVRLSLQGEASSEIQMLKELTWRFVIKNPSLASQQYGRTIVVKQLFEIFADAAADHKWQHILPPRWREVVLDPDTREHPARTAADILSSLADAEALLLHRRLLGLNTGSVLDGLPR